MADLELTVDVSSVTRAEKSINQMQNQLNRLFKKYERGAVTQDAFKRGLLELKRGYADLGVSSQKASGQVQKYVRELEKSAAAQKRAADQKEWFAAQRRRIQMMEESARMERRVAEEAERSAQKQARASERLKEQYLPLYAASKRYERALDEINKAHREGVLSSAQYDTALENLNTQFNQLNTVGQGNINVNRQLGMATQQVGYQVGDFLVQVQSGTNAMVAFGQQATQLVGILPLMADQLNMSASRLIGISAGLGIVIPLVTALGAAYMRTKDTGEEALSSIEEHTKSLIEETKKLRDENALLLSSYENIDQLRLEQERLRLLEQISKEEQLIQRLRDNPELEARIGSVVRERLQTLREELSSLEEKLSKHEEEATKNEQILSIRERIKEAVSGTDFSNPINGANSLLGILERVYQRASAIQSITSGGMSQRALDLQAYGQGQQAQRAQEAAQRYSVDGRLPGIDPPEVDAQGGGSGSGGGSAKKSPLQQANEYLEKLQQEADLKQRVVSLSREETRVQTLVLEMQKRGLPVDRQRIEAIAATEAVTRKLIEAEKLREQTLKTVETQVTSFVNSVVDSTNSIEDAFKTMLNNILQQVWNQRVSQPIGNAVASMIPSFDGGGWTGDGPRSGGVDGKGGYFAVVHPRERITDTTKGGSGGQSVNVYQTFNFSANGDESIKRIISQEAPRIAEYTKSSLLEDRRRGGATRAVFG